MSKITNDDLTWPRSRMLLSVRVPRYQKLQMTA